MRDGRLQGIEAIVERQQRMPPEATMIAFSMERTVLLGFLGASRTIGDGLALLPFRDSLLIDPVAPGECSSGSLDYFVLLDRLPPSWRRSRVKLLPERFLRIVR